MGSVAIKVDTFFLFKRTDFTGYLFVDWRPTDKTYYFHYLNGVKTEQNQNTSGTHTYTFSDMTIVQNSANLTFTFPKAVSGVITLVVQTTTASRSMYMYNLNNVTTYTVNCTAGYANNLTVLVS